MKNNATATAEDGPAILGGTKHARFHDPDVVYHVLLRCFQGMFLLRPDERGILNGIIAGVIGRAQRLWPNVQLYAHAWLSNHGHLMVKGPPEDLPQFIGFIQREISRRWGPHIGWSDRMWRRYESTALVGAESQLRAFRYILSQSTKEHLVESPLKWPGVHCAKNLARGTTLAGTWFNGTAYGKAVHAQSACVRPKPVHRRDFLLPYEVVLKKLPDYNDLREDDYQALVADIITQIEEEAAVARRASGKRILGRRRVLSTPRRDRSELPKQPWYEGRRRMVVWANRLKEETRAYLHRYWDFQRRFRIASDQYCSGDSSVTFPAGSYRPSIIAT